MKKFFLLTLFLCLFSVVVLKNGNAMSIQNAIQAKWMKANEKSQNNFSSANGMYIKGYVFYDDEYDPLPVSEPMFYQFLTENEVRNILVNQLHWSLLAQLPNLEIYYSPEIEANTTDFLLLIYYKDGLAHQAIMLNGTLP